MDMRPAHHDLEYFDTVIIGGGQAGLAVGHYLAQAGASFVILDKYDRVGDCWRERYDSLRLYTPARFDGLPGMPFPAPRRAFPTGNQMADFLEAYAAKLPVRTGVSVNGLRPCANGAPGYVVSAGSQSFRAAQVVVATGPQHVPHIPDFAGQLDAGIRHIHSSDYRNPSQLLPGGVLVVGASHSGADIALEIAQSHPTTLSGPATGQIPFDLEGRVARAIMPVMWFMANHVLTVKTPIGRKMQPEVRGHGGPLLRVRAADLVTAGVDRTEARTVGVRDGLPLLDDGRVVDVSNVVWCTGFQRDFGWIDLPVIGSDGWPMQDRGVVSTAPGLYFVGLLFQHSFSSMLIGGVGRDAKHIAAHILSRPPATSGARASQLA